MKDSSGNVAALTETMRRVPADFQVMTGNAPTFLAALALGAWGGILAVANVAAQPYRKLYDAFCKGDLKTLEGAATQPQPARSGGDDPFRDSGA